MKFLVGGVATSQPYLLLKRRFAVNHLDGFIQTWIPAVVAKSTLASLHRASPLFYLQRSVFHGWIMVGLKVINSLFLIFYLYKLKT